MGTRSEGETMKRKLPWKYGWIILTCLAIVGITEDGTSVFAENTPGVTDSRVKLGMILDQTGPAANVTIPITRGIQR